ncbi:MAG: helicase-related protein [Vampirovibrionales bacterium]
MRLIDNYNELLGNDLLQTVQSKNRLKIAASCFSIYAFEALKEVFSKINSLEFIFTSPTFVPTEATDKIKKEHREFFIPKAERERKLYGTEFEIQLRNKLTQRAIARECAEWLQAKATFKSNKTKSLMQQFACVEQGEQTVTYSPLQGFTAADLGYQQGSAISNFVQRSENPMSASFLTLFNQIWQDKDKLEDVTAIIYEQISSIYQENSPERIYFTILYNLFYDFLSELDEYTLPNDKTGYQETIIWKKLFNYQRDAATGIINKLEMYNGCILADSVGLGKTFTALAVIKYYELRNRSVLVLSPKKLAENWTTYNQNLVTNIFAKDRFNYDVLCHTDLSRNKGQSVTGMALNKINWGNYDLVVIDESHNFRNNEAVKERETRYQRLMNKIIRSGVKTKVLMLSATPVNNRFVDLRNQLALAYEGDSEQLRDKLKSKRSIEEIFNQAQRIFNEWTQLPLEERTPQAILNRLDPAFFTLLDSVTIARSRKHIQMFYDTKDIGSFPKRRKPLSFHCSLTDRVNVLGFNDIFKSLSSLKLSVHAPMSYILPSKLTKYEELYDTKVEGGKGYLRQADREKSLVALMTTLLLKRLESSVEAFRLTLAKLKQYHDKTLQTIEDFQKSSALPLAEFNSFEESWSKDDVAQLEEEEQEALIGKKVKINLADMDLHTWQRELQADLCIVNTLLLQMEQVTPEHDTKLQHLKQQVLQKIQAPINPGNKKVLIFTAFADTANYLYKHLAPLLKEQNLNTARITGKDSPTSTLGTTYDFQSLLTLFSPKSKDKALLLPNELDEIEVLIATDCISEGQNLQDCDYVINYDIHWNPVRIIQRFGRVDRIGSSNTEIQLVNYWPDMTLDEYINLKDRVESRMIITDVTATGDDNVLTAQSTDTAYRKEQLRRLQEEVIELEDVKTGISITDLGLNEFRMDLINHVKTHGESGLQLKGVHAVVPPQPDRGLLPGTVFVLRSINEENAINQSNRLHPYYMVYMNQTGQVIINHTQPKPMLDLLRTACKGKTEPLPTAYKPFNKQTDEGRNMKQQSALLSQAIASMIEVKAEEDIDSLFSSGKTTALQHTIQGLDDFELIAFIVIQEEAAS